MNKNKKHVYSLRAFQYGLTNGCSTLTTTLTSTYWSVFMTATVGIETAVMAMILSISSVIDIISVPICGVLLQKIKFKSGKFRAWLLIGGIGTGLFRWLSFTDLGMTGMGRAIWYGGTYILCSCLYTVAYSAFTGLLPLMAKDPSERVAYASARTTCNSIGKFLFSLTSVALISIFGQGNDLFGYSALAFLIFLLISAGYFQLFVITKDIDRAEDNSVETSNGKKVDKYDASIWEMVKYTISKPFLLYIVSASAKGATFFIVQGLAAYYYTYVVQDKAMLTVYLSASTFLMIGASFLSPYITKVLKNARNSFVLGMAIYGICLGSAFVLGKTPVSFTILMCLGYIGYAIAHSVEVAVYSTVVDYTQWKTGKDLKPFMMSVFSLTAKIGTTIGNMILGFGLVAIGFAATNVTPNAIYGIRVLFSGLPAALCLLSVIFMILFPLTDDKVRKMQKEIENANV